jgi:hypothetical protein
VVAHALGRNQIDVSQRSLNFPNLFERLAHLLGRIRQELPSYQDYVGRLQADPRGLDKEALGKALAFVYADIVSFCRDACRFFSTPFSSKCMSLATCLC